MRDLQEQQYMLDDMIFRLWSVWLIIGSSWCTACDLHPHFDVATATTVIFPGVQNTAQIGAWQPYDLFSQPKMQSQGLVRAQLDRAELQSIVMVATALPSQFVNLAALAVLWEYNNQVVTLATADAGQLGNTDANTRLLVLNVIEDNLATQLRNSDGNLLVQVTQVGPSQESWSVDLQLVWQLRVHTFPQDLGR